MDNDEFENLVTHVRRHLRVTKVVATRSVKTNRGDFFSGFAAAWDSVQDDVSGPGADTDLVMDGGEVTESGMTLREAVVAHGLLAMQADLAAYRAARANGGITAEEFEAAKTAVMSNYSRAMRSTLKVDETPPKTEE
jgi:hypothetical protein